MCYVEHSHLRPEHRGWKKIPLVSGTSGKVLACMKDVAPGRAKRSATQVKQAVRHSSEEERSASPGLPKAVARQTRRDHSRPAVRSQRAKPSVDSDRDDTPPFVPDRDQELPCPPPPQEAVEPPRHREPTPAVRPNVDARMFHPAPPPAMPDHPPRAPPRSSRPHRSRLPVVHHQHNLPPPVHHNQFSYPYMQPGMYPPNYPYQYGMGDFRAGPSGMPNVYAYPESDENE